MSGLDADLQSDGQMPSPPRREAREKELREAYQQMGKWDVCLSVCVCVCGFGCLSE